MKPSVARNVHYQTRGSADGAYPPACFAAIVTAVREDSDYVDLVTFGPEGMRFERSVELDDDGHAGGTWHWPERVES